MSDHSLANPPTTRTSAASRLALARVAALSRTEHGIVALALGTIALHVADDNYLQPQPGTSPLDHLASGLVPLAILTVVGVLYPRLPAVVRAATAMTFGAIGIAFGIPGAYYLLNGSASGDHYTGLLAIVAGSVLLLSGPVTLWRGRRSERNRRRRYAGRVLAGVAALVVAPAIVLLVVFPVAYAYVYTHTGRAASTPELGVPTERVTVTTSDSLQLAAWYVPSKNSAAVVLFPGPTRADEAKMLVRHGYGVLLLEARGQGDSEGDVVRWAGDRDLLAAAAYLRGRPDVDPGRIGGFGFSVGGEILLEAAAKSPAFKAVVSEGGGLRIGDQVEDDTAQLSGISRHLLNSAMVAMSAATTVFSNHSPPPPIVDRIGRIAPRSVFLIYAEPGSGGEDVRQPKYHAAAGEPKAIWKVPGADHTGGIEARPAEYERRVVAFFDRALLETE